jgi:single-stranded DNA-binding protein
MGSLKNINIGRKLNRIWIEGVCGDKLKWEGPSKCYFSLLCKEVWRSKENDRMERSNWFTIVFEGWNVDQKARIVEEGENYLVEGFLKYDILLQKLVIETYSIKKIDKFTIGTTNNIIIQGMVGSPLKDIYLSSGTKLTFFSFGFNEEIKQEDETISKNHWSNVEIMGEKTSDLYRKSLTPYAEIIVNGFLRFERLEKSKEFVKIRAFSFYFLR